MESASSGSAEPKRTSLEMLSKDELLQKCKALLSIAQRAKAAKDEAIQESKCLKEEVESLKKSYSKNEATTEMIEAMTSQKLRLTIELDEAKHTARSAKSECDGLRSLNNEQEVQIESLKRQLGRAEDDCNALENRLERLDSENRRLASVANEAEAQLRRGAAERQDALEGLGDELANVKNAAAEALAERDRLRVQLQQNSPSSNFQTLESCQLLAQELRSSQSLLRADVSELQSAATTMALELGEALAQAQLATEAAARHSSKDLLAEMNEAMKTRGEVAAQLAQKLSDMTKERDNLLAIQSDNKRSLQELEEKYKILQQENEQQKEALTIALNELKETKDSLLQIQKSNENITDEITSIKKKNESDDNKIKNLQESLNDISEEKTKLQDLLQKEKKEYQEMSVKLEDKSKELKESSEALSSLKEKLITLESIEEVNIQLSNNLKDLQTAHEVCSVTICSLEDKITNLEQSTKDNDLGECYKKDLDSPLHDADVLQESLTQAHLESDKLKSELLTTKNINDTIVKKLKELEEKLLSYETISQEVVKKEELIAELSQSKHTSEVIISSMKEDIKKYENIYIEKEKLQEELSDLLITEKKLSEALSTIETLKVDAEVLKNITSEKESLCNEFEILVLKNNELQAIISDKENKLSALKAVQGEDNNTYKEVAELKEKNKELEDLTSALKEKLADLEKDREDCEGASVSTVSRSEDSSRLRDVEESFEDRYTKLRAVAVKLKQKCHDQASVLTKVLAERTELQNKLISLSKERDALAKNVQSMQVACDAATDEAEAARDAASQSNKELKRAGEELARTRNQYAEVTEKLSLVEVKLQQTRADLEAAKQESKKSSVLNLEMAAYERSAAEQDKKLKQFKDDIEALKAELDCQKSIAEDNKKLANQWEEQSKQFSLDKTRLEEQLNSNKLHLAQAQEQFTIESQHHSEAIARFEAKRSELERVELQLAELTAEKLRDDESSKTFREQAARQIHILEDQVSFAQATISAREDEINTLRAEFEGYKVRAQAVLHRQQQHQPQREDQSRETERENELSLLKTTVERLQTALCDAGVHERSLQAEITIITGQHTAMQTSARNLASQVAELNAKCEEITSKLHRSEESLKDTTRQHRLAVDTLSSSYKQQLAEAEKRHKSQIASIQAAQEEMAQQVYVPSTDQEQPPALQPREEGEGSENVDSPKVTNSDSRREPLPLDRLLSSSSDYPDDAKSEISLDAASVSSVLAAERRAKHLSALLGEAEADLARLTQQNAVLKEEIRRQQRCMERQQHTLSNGEYLKNVVLKFVTLQGGDERARLVPVLNTILKLSPEETQQLQTVATGINAPSPGSASSANSWGSYLHLWSGTH